MSTSALEKGKSEDAEIIKNLGITVGVIFGVLIALVILSFYIAGISS